MIDLNGLNQFATFYLKTNVPTLNLGKALIISNTQIQFLFKLFLLEQNESAKDDRRCVKIR